MKQLEGHAWRMVLSQHLGRRFQTSLAQAAHLSGRTIANIIERGNPSGSTLDALAKAIGVARWELLKEVEDLVALSRVDRQAPPITDTPLPTEQKSSDSAEISGEKDSD